MIEKKGRKFDIILADPCWSYGDKLKHLGAGAESHYDVMSVQDICNLDVKSIANKDSVLCMWATMPLLQEALDVIKAWGFKYKTCLFCWVKTYPIQTDKLVLGMGSYTRSNIEICLLAKRGKGLPVLDHTISQIIVAPRKSHSEKPKIVRSKILELFGDKSRVELFSRDTEEGWVSVGNEIDGVLIEDFIEQCKQED